MSHKSVLIIEDEAAIRQTMKDVLELQGFTVYSASNGKDGIDLLNKMDPYPCVILLDMMMPKMNGWEFLDYQRSNFELNNIPVVICSAYAESSKSVNPHAFLEKPLQYNALTEVVRQFCA